MMRLMSRLARFNALSWQDRRLLLAAMAWLPLFWLGLRLLGMNRFYAWLQSGEFQANSSLSRDDIVRIANLVNMAARQTPVIATCLVRSLLLVWMLRRLGISGQLRIGVRMNQGGLDAHAWVEVASIPINDRPDINEQFTPFGDILPLKAFQQQ